MEPDGQPTGTKAEQPPGDNPDVVTAIARALEVIELFSSQQPVLKAPEIAAKTTIGRATARRILVTLAALGYAHRSGNGYHLTPRALRLGYAYLASTPIIDLAQPYLRQLAEKCEEAVSLATFANSMVTYIARVPPARQTTVNLAVGATLPAYPTSIGRMLLAQLSADELENYLEGTPRVAYTQFTVTAVTELRASILEARANGYAINDQERELGVRSVAVALIPPARGDQLYAINISTNSARASLEKIRDEYVPLLRETAAMISGSLPQK